MSIYATVTGRDGLRLTYMVDDLSELPRLRAKTETAMSAARSCSGDAEVTTEPPESSRELGVLFLDEWGYVCFLRDGVTSVV